MTQNNLTETTPDLHAPHIMSGDSIVRIMWTTAAAMLPALLYSSFIHGIHTLLLCMACAASAVTAEAVFQVAARRRFSVTDGSAVVTGLILAMTLPPSFPLWIAAAGSCFAIIAAKQLFGGLGLNLFNPALAGRAVLFIFWSGSMRTAWNITSAGNIPADKLTYYGTVPQQALDIITRTIPGEGMYNTGTVIPWFSETFSSFYDFMIRQNILKSLFMGNYGGLTGEAAVALLLAGGLFILWRGVITWHIPFSFITALALSSYCYYSYSGSPSPGFITFIHIMSGSVIPAAFFMAADPVTSPLTGRGMVLFGAGCGIFTFIIRTTGFYPEGAFWAILIMNAAVPLIDKITKPSIFGLSRNPK
ncbi:MAG TPA: RnfABCDGE type electron transport complex subunit D [Spirochaetota bacterium]|nr:RnfABCDGE type electron transport complex subunit D [Spirochaetota bacterium]